MSFSDWSDEKHGKKKKKNSYTKTNSAKSTASSFAEWSDQKHGRVVDAPVKSSAKEDEPSWFQSGLFEDGWQFGDLTKTILGTAEDVAGDLYAGATGLIESTIDAGAYGVGFIGGLFDEGFRDDVGEFIARDIINEDAVGKTIAKVSGGWVNDVIGNEAEESSVLGEKSDSLVQSAGNMAGRIGLQALGVPWWVTTGVTSFGSSTESALRDGATFGQSGVQGIIGAGAEILTEKLFGGSALGEKGLINLDGLTSGISSKAVKALADFGVDMVAEGAEEVASQFVTDLGSALYKEENLGEILFNENKLEEYIDSFIGGAALGGIMNGGKLVKSVKTGKDYKTGNTASDDKVINKVYEDAIKEREKDGTKLTKKEKAEIYETIAAKAEKGYIDIDTIESTLGGDTYKAYKDSVESREALKKELDTLSDIETGKLTRNQQKRLAELEAMNLDDTSKNDGLRKQLDDMLKPLLENSKINESYAERDRTTVAFQADLNKYKGKQREAVERAVKSGVLNNTNRSHELVEILSKIEADKGIPFDYTNNAKLKETGFALDGKIVNGFVSKGAVTLNVNSAKAWESTVGHEITHILKDSYANEGTNAYTELQSALFEYAESKGELESRRAALTELYNGIETDIDEELTADLVGDYLFNDPKFINSLTSNKNVFQKIYDEIKYLCKVATGKELTQIEKVKREFDKAWDELALKESEANEATDTEVDDVQYSVSVTDTNTIDSLNSQIAKGEYDAETNPDGGYYVTYKSMSFWGYDEDGNAILRSPMAEYVDGKLSNAYLIPKDKSKLNWYQATETIDENTGLPSGLLVKTKKEGNKSYSYLPASENQDLIAEDWSNLYFNLQKKVWKNGKWANSDVPARYNPYEHSSNSMLNDQFSAAYLRDNLVTVKMYVPISEDNGAFRAKWSKDSTGWADWKTGTVAGKINKQKDLQRKVYLSRYAAPVEIVSDAEVAQAYKSYIEGTDVAIPDNVVSPNLLNELKKAGVPIEESGKVKYSLSADGNQLDNGQGLVYNGTRGEEYGRTNEQGNYADTGNGVGGPQGYVGMVASTGENSARSTGLPKFVRLTPKTQESLSKSGVVALELIDSSDDSSAFSIALSEARKSDKINGWCVTPKTAEDLVKYNIRTIMTTDRTAGLGVAPDGDIEAVFKNQNGGQSGVLKTLVPAALEMGGNKLDCYGEGLVNLYSRYGFVPVARVEFNSVHANEGWTPDKGEPYIFFMVHNGDSADTVVSNIGKYKKWTTEELNALPLYDKESYDDAYAYRDTLLPENIAPVQNSLSFKGEQPSTVGTPLKDLALVKDTEVAPTQETRAEDIAPVSPNATQRAKSEQIADGTRGDNLLYESLDNYPLETTEQKIAEKIRAIEGELADNRDLRREAEDNYNAQIAKMQAEYASKKNKNTKVANGLLQSISRLERLKASNDANFAKRISDLEARLEKMRDPKYSTAMQKQAKMQENAEWAENLVGDTSTWKDKKIGLQYATNTERRNLRDIVRDENGNVDIAKADAIDDALNGRYNREEAEKKRELAKIRGKYAELKITNAEHAYIQMLGELRHNPDTTLTKEVVDEYYEKHKKKIDTEKVDKVIELARQDYDSFLIRLNEKLREQGMKEIPYRQGYFLHYTEPKQNFIQKLLNWKVQDDEIPTSIAGLTETFRPVKSWQPFDKTRHTDETDYNFGRGFDTYAEGALDWIYHLDTLQKRRAVENHIRFTHSEEGIKQRIKEVYADEGIDADEAQAQIEHILSEAKNPLNNFVQDFTTHTNILAGKKNSLDRTVEQATNRHIYSVMTNVQNRLSANMVLANVRSALTNFIPITQSWAQVSPLRSLQATKETIANAIKDDGVIDKSTFLTNRLKEADKLYKTNWDKVLDKAGIMFDIVDGFSSQVIWRSKYNQNLADGMTETEAIKNADKFAENVMAGRSKGNEPTLFNAKNPFVKAFTMFQLEVNNQYGYLFKDVPNDLKAEASHAKLNLAKGYATAFIGAYVYNALMEQVAGSGAALDPIGIIEDLLRDLGLFGDDEEEEPEKVVTNLAENVVQELPFVGGLFGGGRIPISSALPYGEDGLTGAIEDISEGNWGNVGKELMNPILNIGLPVGGGQIKKTYQGLKMFSDELPVTGSYTDSGSLRFPVEDTPLNRLQAGIFGQYASENAREYFDNDYAPLKEKQIEEYKDVELPIADYWKYREGLKGLEKTSEKADYIDTLDIEDWQKNLLLNNILDRKEDVDMSNYGDYGSFEEFDFAQQYPERHSLAKSVGGYDVYKTYAQDLYDIKADRDAYGKSINGSRKEKVVEYINNLDADYGAKLILFKSEYPSDDTYNMDIVSYINGLDGLTYEERVAIFKELGFTVSGDTVYWD